jgi:ABC-type phosphonate transport system ATPase subunit
MIDFLIECRTEDGFVVMHPLEGHRFHFHVGINNEGRRVLSAAKRIHRNLHSAKSADLFEGAARRAAIREALAVGLIDVGC